MQSKYKIRVKTNCFHKTMKQAWTSDKNATKIMFALQWNNVLQCNVVWNSVKQQRRTMEDISDNSKTIIFRFICMFQELNDI